MLTDEHRATIIAIKQARSSRPEHPPGISTRIYDAVLDHDIRTVEQFDQCTSSMGPRVEDRTNVAPREVWNPGPQPTTVPGAARRDH